MAIIKLGGTVVGVRGTIGGLTFSANKGGPYVKTWGKGANPQTSGQQSARGALASLGPLWNSLSSSQRSDWDTYAATDPEPHVNSLGEPIVFSGYGLFSMLGMRRLKVNSAPYEDIPTGSDAIQPAAPVSLTWDPDYSGANMDLDMASPTGGLVDVFIALVPSVASVPSVQRAAFLAQISASLNPQNMYVTFNVAYGADYVGWNSKVWCYTRRTSGLRSVAATEVAEVY